MAHRVYLAVLTALSIPAGVSAQTTQPAAPDASPPTTQPTTAPASGLSMEDAFIRATEQAHRSEEWRRHEAFQCDLVVEFGGATMLEGTMLYELHGRERVRLTLADGSVLVFDGEKAWVSPADAEVPNPRFHLLTWPYFLAVPYKLRDPGVKLERGELEALEGRLCQTARLTFAPGTGDSPDDWYLIYQDPMSSRIHCMAYIVTYGTDAVEAEKEPHAIVYSAFVGVEGVPIPTVWTFRHWSEDRGTHGESIGEVRLSNLSFVKVDDERFAKPSGAREDAVPK